MSFTSEDDEIECEIIESFGIFSKENYSPGMNSRGMNSRGNRSWHKEINLISWNGRPAKIDIRNWQKDHTKCGKGIAITREEAEELVKLLGKILKNKPETKTHKSETKTRAKKKPVVPQTLEPFYDELELLFGAGPDECKSARNTLLKKYHPDKNAANIAFATRKTIKIKDAYERLMMWWNENLK